MNVKALAILVIGLGFLAISLAVAHAIQATGHARVKLVRPHNASVDVVASPGENAVVSLTVPTSGNGTRFPQLNLNMNDAGAVSLNKVGEINVANWGWTNPGIATITAVTIGTKPKDLGGALIFNTKLDGSATTFETLQLTHEGHIGCPGDCFETSISSPPACAALATCGTLSYTFTNAFYGSNSSPQTPLCSAPGIQDTTHTSMIWLGNLKAVSSSSVTYNYAPTTATSSSDSLVVTFECWNGSY